MMFIQNATFETQQWLIMQQMVYHLLQALILNTTCTIENLGCTDPSACNYNSNANTDDGSCYNNI